MRKIAKLFITCMVFMSGNLIAQNGQLILDRMESKDPFKEFTYTGPESEKIDYTIEKISKNQDIRLVKEGNHSLLIRWNLTQDQWCGWGIKLNTSKSGYDASKFKYLTFWVLGAKGGESFEVKAEDIAGNRPSVYVVRFLPENTEISRDNFIQIKIPLIDFVGLDLTRIDNINLAFTLIECGPKGTVYIDDFRLE